MSTGRRFICVLLLSLAPTSGLHAHPDLLLQIDALTQKLERQPDNVTWLLQRGDLERRHEDWPAARADFHRVREIQPHNQTVDWFEGRLDVLSGDVVQGRILLDRFLKANPDNAIAIQNRAQANLLLHQPLLAAGDYETVIRLSERAAPAIFRAHARALVAAGDTYFPAALRSVMQGLHRFPGEVALSGLGSDISLAMGDVEATAKLLGQLPKALLNLPQWKYRHALLECIRGKRDEAQRVFSTLASEQPRSSSEHLPPLLIKELAAAPLPPNCQAAARASLEDDAVH